MNDVIARHFRLGEIRAVPDGKLSRLRIPAQHLRDIQILDEAKSQVRGGGAAVASLPEQQRELIPLWWVIGGLGFKDGARLVRAAKTEIFRADQISDALIVAGIPFQQLFHERHGLLALTEV